MGVQPMLASTLLDEDELDAIVQDGFRSRVKSRDGEVGERTRMGVQSLDAMFRGGMKIREIVGVSSEGSEGLELSLHVLIQSLLSDPTNTVSIIDTRGNIDVIQIYNPILSHLNSQPELLASLRSSDDKAAEDVAIRILDRVKISRAFDWVGVVEAVGEVREGLEGKHKGNDHAERPKATQQKAAKETQKAVQTAEEPVQKPKRTIVLDSEDEEDDMLFETQASPASYKGKADPDDDISFKTHAPQTDTSMPTDQSGHNPAPQNLQQTPHAGAEITEPTSATVGEGIAGKTSLILIDNLAHVLTPLLKSNHTQANALLSSFLTSLCHLTRTHSLITLLLNPAAPPRPISKPPPPKAGGPLPPQQQPVQQIPPSIFASNPLIPALGNVLPVYVDLHLMVSKIPKDRMGARVWYADSVGSGAGVAAGMGRSGKKVDLVNVVEVLSDRSEGRSGDWGTFVMGSDGVIKGVP